MSIHRHLALRHLVALALAVGLVGAVPADARHERGRDVTQLAAGLEAATDDVRREIRGGFWGRRGGDARLEHDLADLQRQASHFRHGIARRAPGSQGARAEVAALLQRFYDADRTIRKTGVPSRARADFERARYFMDALIDRYGGYGHFRHVRPSQHGSHHRGEARRHDDRRRHPEDRHRPREHRRWPPHDDR